MDLVYLICPFHIVHEPGKGDFHFPEDGPFCGLDLLGIHGNLAKQFLGGIQARDKGKKEK